MTNYEGFGATYMTLGTCTTTLTEMDVCEVARVSTNGFLHQVPCTMTRAQHKSKGE